MFQFGLRAAARGAPDFKQPKCARVLSSRAGARTTGIAIRYWPGKIPDPTPNSRFGISNSRSVAREISNGRAHAAARVAPATRIANDRGATVEYPFRR
jgi:hypothetical protein